MKPRILRLIAFLVALLLAVTLSGCGSEGSEAGGGAGSGNNLPQSPTAPPAPDSTDELIAQIEADPLGACPDEDAGYENVGYNGLTGEAATLYSEILVCSNGTSSFLVNDSDGVWVFDMTVPTMEFKEYGQHSRFFRLSGVPRSNLYYMVPGDSVIIEDVTTISWYPSEMMTSVWATQELGLGYVQGRGEEYLAMTIEKKTGHSKAITECMFTAAQAAAKKSEMDETSDLIDHLQAGLKTAKAGICLSAMKQADSEADAAGYRQVQAKPSWDARVSKLSSEADTGLDMLKFLHFGAAACKIAPRCS
ncbi:hypothetical protein ACX80W_14745 [Arthrobacter sp. TMN-37]